MVGNSLLVLISNLVGLLTSLNQFLYALLDSRGTLRYLLDNLLVAGRELISGVNGEHY